MADTGWRSAANCTTPVPTSVWGARAPPGGSPADGHPARNPEGGEAAKAGRLYGVGVGPGDPELVTVKAARLISAAGVIAYHCARHGRRTAPRVSGPHLRPG